MMFSLKGESDKLQFALAHDNKIEHTGYVKVT